MYAEQQRCTCVFSRGVTCVHYLSCVETGHVLLPVCRADSRLKSLNSKGTKAGEPEGEGERMSRRDDNVA